jgi:threonylcarbamoyladenosine tRNA methylthiotransferase CDKAL1
VAGLSKVFVEVFGCSANLADSEIVSGILLEAGYSLVERPEEADALVVLTCTVKTPTERRVVKRLRQLQSLGTPLVVAGCMPEAQPDLVVSVAPEASMVGPDGILDIVEAVEATLAGNRIEAVGGEAPDRACLPRVRANPVIHIAPISSGCLGDCSYCIVRRARGRLNSFPMDGVVEDALLALEGGCREVWVTAEDTAAYRWRDSRLPDLLGALISLEGEFFIRVGMMTPNQALPIVDNLIEAFSSERVFKFLHIPVQSGSDEVLGRMRRRYTVEEFVGLVERFRGALPWLTLSTDIICGFPGETEGQFEESLKLIERIEPEVLNISRFGARPGTEAAGMEGQIHGRITKERSRRLTELWKRVSLERSHRWKGWRGRILIDEAGKNGGVIGRNFAYKPVVLSDDLPRGQFVEVEITEARGGYLLGRTA